MKGLLTSVLIFIVLSGLNSQCDPSFQYFAEIDLDNTGNAQSYTEHQVLITVNTMDLINQGKMNADGSDIRFYDSSCNPICHLIESGFNTASTSIWVNVPSLPASTNTSILMKYGNSLATTVEDGECTFDFYEDFNDNTFNLINNCGNGTMTSDGNYGMISWSSSGVFYSNHDFQLGSAYTVEAMVMGVSGTWPAIYLINAPGEQYGLLTNSTQARISVTGGGTDVCSGHNWASGLFSWTNPDGLWSLTWAGTGDIRADFPTVGPITSTDMTYALDSDLAVGIGGISSGTGNFMQVDWLRVRRFSENPIPVTIGQENMSAPIPTLSFWGALVLGICLIIFSAVSLKSKSVVRI